MFPKQALRLTADERLLAFREWYSRKNRGQQPRVFTFDDRHASYPRRCEIEVWGIDDLLGGVVVVKYLNDVRSVSEPLPLDVMLERWEHMGGPHSPMLRHAASQIRAVRQGEVNHGGVST